MGHSLDQSETVVTQVMMSRVSHCLQRTKTCLQQGKMRREGCKTQSMDAVCPSVRFRPNSMPFARGSVLNRSLVSQIEALAPKTGWNDAKQKSPRGPPLGQNFALFLVAPVKKTEIQSGNRGRSLEPHTARKKVKIHRFLPLRKDFRLRIKGQKRGCSHESLI